MTLPLFPGVDFDPVIEAYARGNHVNLPPLAYFDFEGAPRAVWPGEYDITAGGITWLGLGAPGRVVAIDGLEQAASTEASQFTITLSGTDAATLTIASSEDRTAYVGRLLGIYALFCDADWQPLTAPLAVGAGIMCPMEINKSLDGTVWKRSITLPADNIFYGRSAAPASFYTDTDQQQRYPGAGDRGLQFIPGLQDTPIPVPWR